MKTTKRISLLMLLCVALFSVQTASAQIRYGIRAGVDVINNDINTDMFNVNNRTGFSVGGSLDFRVPLIGLGIETGAQYAYRNYKGKNMPNEGKISNYNSIMVPLLIKKQFSVLGIAGIYVKGGMYGDIRISGGTVKTEDVKYDPKSFNKGLAAGAGISLLNHLELGLDYRHRLGSTYTGELKKHNFNKLGRNAWSVTLAYYM